MQFPASLRTGCGMRRERLGGWVQGRLWGAALDAGRVNHGALMIRGLPEIGMRPHAHSHLFLVCILCG